MDPGLRRAWTEIVTAEDYDEHMAAIGQAQAGAALTAEAIRDAKLRPGSRVLVAGAGTGQMFDFLGSAPIRPFQLICTDLNANFLDRLRGRLRSHDLTALLVADDIENTGISAKVDLLTAVLLLEHIDWRKGVEAIARAGPAICAIVIQENPPGMATAVTPGRRIPSSIAAAMQFAQPALVPHRELVTAFEARGYRCGNTRAREAADGKRLVLTLFSRE